MNNLPTIRDTNAELTSDCCDSPEGIKELHRVPRVPLTRAVSNPGSEDVLQDEDGLAVKDELTNGFITTI